MSSVADLIKEIEAAGLRVGFIYPYLCQLCSEEEYVIQLWTPDGQLWAEGSAESAETVRQHIQNYVERDND